MRKHVKGWLKEEGATQTQTLQLLNAIYAGVIDGDTYKGKRSDIGAPVIDVYPAPIDFIGPEEQTNAYGDEVPGCGCLLDTLERIQGGRRRAGIMKEHSAIAFNLAIKIPYGVGPEKNVWSRAAAEGVEDYYQERGWR